MFHLLEIQTNIKSEAHGLYHISYLLTNVYNSVSYLFQNYYKLFLTMLITLTSITVNVSILLLVTMLLPLATSYVQIFTYLLYCTIIPVLATCIHYTPTTTLYICHSIML